MKSKEIVQNAREAWVRAQSRVWESQKDKVLGLITEAADRSESSCVMTFYKLRLTRNGSRPNEVTIAIIRKNLESLGFKVEVDDKGFVVNFNEVSA
jgi:hypothetical protein